jgi:hypothetical protein
MLPVAAGDAIFVDAGTVHAIWPGSILLETQQNCDLTYRMYDYGRGRELHIEKSLEATRLVTRAGKVAAKVLADRTILLDEEYFRVERLTVAGSRSSKACRAKVSGLRGWRIFLPQPGRGGLPGKDSIRSICPRGASWPCRRLRRRLRSRTWAVWSLIRISPNWPGSPATGLGRRGGWPEKEPNDGEWHWRESVEAYIRAEAQPVDKFGHSRGSIRPGLPPGPGDGVR